MHVHQQMHITKVTSVQECNYVHLLGCSVIMDTFSSTYLSIGPTHLTLSSLSAELPHVTDWYMLGVHLDIPHHKLDEIEKNYTKDNGRCKLEIFKIWLSADEHPTWKKIVQALKRMGENSVANRIQEKYTDL